MLLSEQGKDGLAQDEVMMRMLTELYITARVALFPTPEAPPTVLMPHQALREAMV